MSSLKVDRAQALRKMSELLRAGAMMLSDTCPQCGLPLFKLRSGEVVCPIHGRVYVARSEEEAEKFTLIGVLDSVEDVVVSKLAEMRRGIEQKGLDEDLIRRIIGLLEVIERIERIKREVLSERRSEGSLSSRSQKR